MFQLNINTVINLIIVGSLGALYRHRRKVTKDFNDANMILYLSIHKRDQTLEYLANKHELSTETKSTLDKLFDEREMLLNHLANRNESDPLVEYRKERLI